MLRQAFLIFAVAAVGVLHTIVPDHWLPIALLSREHGWTRAQTGRAAFGAGVGHVVSTLLIGLVVWFAGVAVAARFGHLVDVASGAALVGFGLWISVGAWLEQRAEAGHPHQDALEIVHHDHHSHDYLLDRDGREPDVDVRGAGDTTAVAVRHRHAHVHAGGLRHTHAHVHDRASAHSAAAIDANAPPMHEHAHQVRGRTALLLILGSSPMLEGIPAFFAASRYGIGLVSAMSVVFALSTIATYVSLCVYSAGRLQTISIGPLERYGEVISGGLIAAVGVVFLIRPVL
jgi:ABC-type nickel/cobalt efflux system permease component RcnA